MNIDFPDYFLARVSKLCRHLLRWVGDCETSAIKSRLNEHEVVRPVYVCGLARSGSTILLELLSRVEGVATHRYCDFPFQSVPWLWNKYLRKVKSVPTPIERPNGDRILIDRESPEAMEEPLWMMFFQNLHSTKFSQALTEATNCPSFSQFYDSHVRKMLLIRRGNRYICKNNYNVGRIAYLLKLYPDAHFIVPIRHPWTHTHSLVTQHLRFSEFARANSRVGWYLQAAGHFEFGPQRIPIQFDCTAATQTLGCWARGDEHLGYAVQWKEVYGLVQRLRDTPLEIANRIHVIRYEDFCKEPRREFSALLRETGFSENTSISLDHVDAASHPNTLTDDIREAIWQEVGTVASKFGYSATF